MAKTILFIHQSSELYGSDKTLLYLVEELQKDTEYIPLVVLPDVGPLTEALKKRDIKVLAIPVIKLSRKMLSFSGIVTLPFTIFSAIKSLNQQLKHETIDIVHSNTLAVLLGAFYAKYNKIKHIWHVHEIIEHPKFVSRLYPKIVHFFADKVVYNSNASLQFLCNKKPVLLTKSKVVWNGLSRSTEITTINNQKKIRKDYFKSSEQDILIGLVGRINRWKGHLLLTKVFQQLTEKFQNVKLVFLGSTPPNQEYFLQELKKDIAHRKLNTKVVIIPFQTDIWKFYDTFDIVVVPSTEPEPFGLVAIEAMLAKKPVIAANHGGLKEIVIHNETGLLFEPNNGESLKECLETLINNKTKRLELANNGYYRAKTIFSLKNHAEEFKEIYQNLN